MAKKPGMGNSGAAVPPKKKRDRGPDRMVSIEVPTAEPPSGYGGCSRCSNVELTEAQHHTLARVLMGCRKRVLLRPSGQTIDSGPDVIRHILDQIGEALAVSEGK